MCYNNLIPPLENITKRINIIQNKMDKGLHQKKKITIKEWSYMAGQLEALNWAFSMMATNTYFPE